MDSMLFTSRSVLTMIHGIVLGGGALMTLAAALFYLAAMRSAAYSSSGSPDPSRPFVWITIAAAVLLWLTVIGGTYVIFPPYRATPPEGLTELSAYPRALLQSNRGTAWLHGFAMEIKEHVPWITAMLATAVAFVAARYRSALFSDASLRRSALMLLAIVLVLASAAGLLGIFINKVAPLE
jgi:hypothetical protein